MYVGGTVISSVEFHGNMSLVIFMSKCPLACRYCHNVELLEDNTERSLEEIKEEIDSSADFLDAIVISGGEPLVQTDDVIEILKYVRQIGLKTKLDTSGIYPDKIMFHWMSRPHFQSTARLQERMWASRSRNQWII